jgi:hypothetical protein
MVFFFQNVGKSASSAQQSTSAALPGSQYARMAGNPVQTFAAPMPMARVSALQSHAQPRMPQPQVYYPQPQMPQVAMQQPLVAMQQPQVAMQQPQVAMQQPRVAMQQPRVAMQQPQHEFRHQAVGSTPSERRQRLLRVQVSILTNPPI